MTTPDSTPASVDSVMALSDDLAKAAFKNGKETYRHGDAVVAARAALGAEVERLAQSAPTDDAMWDQTLQERDTYHDWADKLAEGIAAHLGVDIGEHTAGAGANNPWANALEAIQAVAQSAPLAQPAAAGQGQAATQEMLDGLLEAAQYLSHRRRVAAAPPAPGGDVHDRRSETGMPMSANAPEKCPITRRPFFMVISHPELGWVPTYGGPYDSYTIPHMEGKPDEPYHERELTCHHYDHDYGGWVDDESISMRVINEGVLNDLLDAADALQSTQGQDAAPAEQPQDDEPTWQELEDFRKRHWTHWNAADNLLIAHLAQKLKCAARPAAQPGAQEPAK